MKPRARSLPLLAIATVLAGGALAAGEAGARSASASDRPPTPDAPLAVAAAEPALALSTFHSALTLLAPVAANEAMEIASEAEQRAGAELGSLLGDGVDGAAIALVAACPPPANLGCKPGLRALLMLDAEADRRRLTRELAALLPAGLRAAGFSDLSVEVRAGAGIDRVRVTSAEETLGLARISAESARVALGGVSLPSALQSDLNPAAGGLGVSLRPAGLEQLLEDETGALTALSELTTRIEIDFVDGPYGAGVAVRAEGR